MKTCKFCAEEIQDAAIVCRHCGRSPNDFKERMATSGRQIRTTFWWLMAVLIGGPVILLGIFLLIGVAGVLFRG